MKTLRFKDFVDSKCCPSSLDSVHGNLGLDMYTLVVCREAVENSGLRSELQEIQDLVKEDKLYCMDKGEYPMYDYLKTLDSDQWEDLGGGLRKYSFEQGVNIYSPKPYTLYINARRVILPCKTTIVKGPKRLYVIGDSGRHYKLPVLPYPKALKPFLKWAQKKKILPFKVSGSDTYIWNKQTSLVDATGDLGWGWSDGDYPVWNLKSESDLLQYDLYLQTEYKKIIEEFKKRGCSAWIPSSIPEHLNLIDCPLVTEAMVEEFIDYQNNKFKVER